MSEISFIAVNNKIFNLNKIFVFSTPLEHPPSDQGYIKSETVKKNNLFRLKLSDKSLVCCNNNKKSRIRETLNLSTDADHRTNAKITRTRFRMGSGGYNPEKI